MSEVGIYSPNKFPGDVNTADLKLTLRTTEEHWFVEQWCLVGLKIYIELNLYLYEQLFCDNGSSSVQ